MTGTALPDHIIVIVAVIERDARILVTRRLPGTHLAGYWEFPGGKLEAGETHDDCLRRELREELDAEIKVGSKLHTSRFTYPSRALELHFYSCTALTEPRPMLGQEMRWVPRSELAELQLPPADIELVRRLTA